MENKIDIKKLTAFEFKKYENIDLNSLTVYVLSFLLENKIPTTFEIIVVTLFRMFPEKFSLEGFKEFPDATRVNRALLQLRPKYRSWAQGDVQLGFTLTEEGKLAVKKVKILLEKAHLQKPRKSIPRKRTLSPDAEITNIEKSKIFQSYMNGEEENIADRDIYAFLKAFSYTPPKILKTYLHKLKGHAQFNKREDITTFLIWLEKKYHYIFKPK